MFIEQLKLQFSQGYNPEKAAIFAHEFYFNDSVKFEVVHPRLSR